MVTGTGNDDDELLEEHTVGAMGILTTLETILGLLEEHPAIVKQVEPIVRSCIVAIFECYCESILLSIYILFLFMPINY